MEITYLSNSCIQFSGKNEKLVIDPDKKILGNFAGRIMVFSSEERRDSLDNAFENKVAITGPGGYEVGGVEIEGLSTGDGGSYFYKFTLDGVGLGFLGKLDQELGEKKMEKIEDMGLDVLVCCLDGKLPAKYFWELAKKIGVNFLLPFSDDLARLKEMLDLADMENVVPVNTFKVTPDNLPEGLEVVLLKTA